MKVAKYIILLIVPFFLVSCEEKCDEPDVQRINSLFFEIKQGGSDGYTQDELNNMYFIRFVPLSNPVIGDTVYPEGYYNEGAGKFTLNDTYPFNNEEPPYFVDYGYLLIGPEPGDTTRIENIELLGEYTGDCGYNNLQKTFMVDSVEQDFTGSMNYFLITK